MPKSKNSIIFICFMAKIFGRQSRYEYLEKRVCNGLDGAYEEIMGQIRQDRQDLRDSLVFPLSRRKAENAARILQSEFQSVPTVTGCVTVVWYTKE